MENQQYIKEIIKCKESFPYFARNYIKIYHPEKGLVNFNLYDFQEKKVLPNFENERFVILKKFRQGGLSTLATMYSLWKILFFTDCRILMISVTDREAKNLMAMVKIAWDNLPNWLKCEPLEYSQHVISLETGSWVRCGTPKMGRGYSANIIVIDEAAFIEKMEDVWKAIFPVLSAGGRKGKAFVISTVNGLGNWYSDTYHDAKNKLNLFKVIDLEYTEHPDYNNDQYRKTMMEQLGAKGFAQEILGEFLGSSDTFIRPETLKYIQTIVDNMDVPIKSYGENNDSLWIWQKPIKGRNYLLCADVSEGLGGNHDYHAFHILDMNTMEQVAEFYNNEIKTNEYSKVIHETATYYNKALVTIENNGYGHSVLEKLYYDLEYENIYWNRMSKRKVQMGIKTNAKTRKLILNCIETGIENKYVKIKSARLLHELQSFVFNPNNKKAQAREGRHDDLVMALGIGLFTRNLITKQAPFAQLQDEMGDFKQTFDADYEKTLQKLGIEEEQSYIEEENSEEYDREELACIMSSGNSDKDFDEDEMLKEFGWIGD